MPKASSKAPDIVNEILLLNIQYSDGNVKEAYLPATVFAATHGRNLATCLAKILTYKRKAGNIHQKMLCTLNYLNI